MVLTITQETFNEAVQENMEVLGMAQEEAVSEAVTQFKAQGVDLKNIITSSTATEEFANLNNIVQKLVEAPSKPVSAELPETINLLRAECDKGIEFKINAAKLGAYKALLEICSRSDGEKNLKITALKALTSLTSKQPDILDDSGVELALTNLKPEVDTEIQKQTLRWIREACVMHEMNRQKLVAANNLEQLHLLLKEEKVETIKEILLVMRALILDDDVRVEFGKAHEHAKAIASQNLNLMIKILQKFKADELVVVDLLFTISALLVRTEFCKTMEEAGILDVIHEIMTNLNESDKIVRQSFKVLKALAGNDQCKVAITQKGLAPVISTSLNTHKGAIPTAAAGLNCIAALSLRSPENSKILFEASIPDVIINTMKLHPNEKTIQKPASWAIRNMVSRSRYQKKHFLELGAEEILHTNLGKFKEFEYDIKAALRDLECKVDLKEEWTGKGGAIHTDAIKTE